MRSEQALVGKKVRVRGERYKPELRGEVRSVLRCFGASVLRCYGEPEYLAPEVVQ